MSLLLTLILLLQSQVERGVVTGQVRLKDGSTEAGVRVAARPVPASDPSTPTELTGLAQTDASGCYRLELPPGAYYIAAGPLVSPMYYPGVTKAATAKPVEVKAGATTEAIDFELANPLAVHAVHISGRIPKPPDALSAMPLRVLLRRPGIADLETVVAPDGTFEFAKVTPGSYGMGTLPDVGLTPMNVIVTDHDITGIDLRFSDARLLGKGFKVEGTTAGPVQLPPIPSGNPFVLVTRMTIVLTGQASVAQLSLAQSASMRLEALIQPDGSFEFRNVPPGTYNVRSLVNSAGPKTIVVADHDLNGVKVAVSAPPMQVRGVISVEDGSPPPNGLTIQVRRGGASGNIVSQSGAFGIPYVATQGDHEVSVSTVPLGYIVKSITYDGTDLTTSPLKLSGPPTAQVKVVLAKLPPESIHGVRVTGRLGPATKYPSGISLFLISTVNGLIEAPIGTDGTFNFPKVPPGSYRWRFSPGGGVGPAEVAPTLSIVVGDKDILGLTIKVALPAEISGAVRCVDRNGKDLSVFPANVMVTYSTEFGSSNGSSSIGLDGTFRLRAPDGDIRVSANHLPDGYRLKSVTAGTLDLIKEPLHVGVEPISGIEVVIEFVGDEH